MHIINDLSIWKKSIDFSFDMYKITNSFPQDERFGLISQMRKSAVSIPSNIAEGAGRNSDKEFIHFLGISNGSSNELLTQIIISNRLGFISNSVTESVLSKIDEIQKMNHGLKKSLDNKTNKKSNM
jgi:four helix bundle protein